MESVQYDSVPEYVKSGAQADSGMKGAISPLQLAIPINAKRIARLLTVIALSLALLSIVGRTVDDAIGGDVVHPSLSNLLWKFNVDYEQSIPTWFSSAILLGSAGLLGIIAMAKRSSQDRYARHWLGLAIIFLYLS